ncbi:hypothetical protein FQA39_LY12586 [Lamprigera yunnana]|nr:hypothetical protein FQA39_LY12586 [Lamprigera yunnana]
MNPIPKNYEVKPGTVEFGRDYEFKIAALLSLRCLHKKNMWIAMNASYCGAFDDVILSFEKDDGKNVNYLIQLKHSENPSVIKRKEFKAKKGNFELAKYYTSIKEIKDTVETEENNTSDFVNHLRLNIHSTIFILFTNRSVETQSNYLMSVGKSSEMEENYLLDRYINTNGEIFLFNFEQLQFEVESDDQMFMNKLCLFSSQACVSELDPLIKSCVQELLKPSKVASSELNEIYQKFIGYITQWSKGELGGFYPLTKSALLKCLFEYITKPYQANIVQSRRDFNRNVCGQFMSKSKIIIIQYDEVVLQFANDYVNYAIRKAKKLWKNEPDVISKEMLRPVNVNRHMKFEEYYEYLWKTGRLPIYLQVDNDKDYRFLLSLLKIFENPFKVIIFLENISLRDSKNNVGCVFLKDLEETERCIILNLPVKLQERRSIKLSSFMNDDMLRLLTIKDIIYILQDKYSVGCDASELPEIFIDRSFQTLWLKPHVLSNGSKDKFVIYCKSIDSFQIFASAHDLSFGNTDVVIWNPSEKQILNNLCRIIIVTETEPFASIKHIYSGSNLHYVILHIRYGIEWLSSFGSNKNILDYVTTLDNSSMSNDDTSSIIDHVSRLVGSEVYVISAYPGMGKSTTLNYLLKKAPTDWWTVRINLIDHNDYFKKKNHNDCHLEYFSGITEKDFIAKVVFNYYVKRKKVLLLFDGFDEVPISLQKKVLKLFVELREEGYPMYITTRPSTKSLLEDSLHTFAIELTPFTKQNQYDYIVKYFSEFCDLSELDAIKEFVNKLVIASNQNLNDQDQEFIGVPLQTKLLAEVFVNDCKKYIATKTFVNESFNLIYLYKHFINKKIEIVCEKFGKGSDDMLEQYKNYRSLFALKTLFLEEDLEYLEIDTKLKQLILLLPETLHNLQKDGIVILEKNCQVKFVHKTFAEYLAAKWLSKNFDDEENGENTLNLFKKLFSINYVTVRNMFDRILAKRCPLHLAVINRHRDAVEKIIKDDDQQITKLDVGGRSVFHLIASWGVHHPFSSTSSKQVQALAELLSNDVMVHIFELVKFDFVNSKDDLFHYTTIDYALASGSLNIGDILCAHLTNLNQCITINISDMNYLLSYLNWFMYSSLATILLKHSIVSEVENLIQDHDDRLHNAIFSKKLFEVAALLSNGYKSCVKNRYNFDALHVAAIYGDPFTNKLLFIEGSEVNCLDNFGRTPLHWAVIKSRLNIVLLLLSNDAETSVRDDRGMTPLHYVAISGAKDQIEIATALIQYNASISISDNYGKTTVYYAIYYNQSELIKLLLRYSDGSCGNIDADEDGGTLLHWAADKGNAEIIKLLLSHGANVEVRDEDGKTPMHWAAEQGHLDVLTLLLSQGANIDATENFGRTPLHLSISQGHVHVTKLLLSKGCRIDQKDALERTVLFEAISKNVINKVPELLSDADLVNQRDTEKMTIMHWAAFRGNSNAIRLLLSKGVEYESLDKYGRNPLICAAQYGHVEIVRVFISQNVSLEIKDNTDMTALHWASWGGHENVVEVLLSHRLNIHLKDGSGRTALMCAVHNGHTNLANHLIKNGANINDTNNDGMSVLNWACHNGYFSTAKLILEHKCEMESRNVLGRTALVNAASKGHFLLVKLLLAYDVDIEAKDLHGMNSLHCAAFKGHLNIVELLIHKGANKDALSNYEKTALIYAANSGHVNIVNFLLENDANIHCVDNENLSALSWAAHDGHTDCAAVLLNHHADIECTSKQGNTPLLYATQNGHNETVKMLLLHNASPNVKDNLGMYPLHHAAYNGHIDNVNTLLHKTEIDLRDADNRTPLLHAAFNGYDRIVNILIENGANINAQDCDGLTALHWTCCNCHVTTAELLLQHNADANIKDLEELTPVMYAIIRESPPLVKMLIKKSDVSITTNKNKTLLHLAARSECFEIVETLLNVGVDVNAKDQYKGTALIYACAKGTRNIVDLLLSRNANHEEKDELGLSAMDWATMNNHTSIVSLLVEKNSEMQCKSD